MRSSGRDPDKNNICSRLVEHTVYQKAVCTTEKKNVKHDKGDW